MISKPFLRSFAGGEITPELVGRLDLTKNQTGLAKALNFQILPHGPAANRPGTDHVLETKTSASKSVLVPFIFNTEQAYALEFGDQYMRIHLNGATLLNTAQNITGISQANPGVLTYAGADPANGTWMYLTSIGGMTQLNGRFVKVANVNAGANTFELTDLNGANINTTAYGAWTAGGTIASVYEIATPYLEADLFDLHFTQSNDVLTIVHPGYQQRHLTRVAALNWTLATFTLVPTQAAPTGITVTPNAAGAVTYTYLVTAIAADGLEESLAPAGVANALCQDLTVAGAFNTVTWTDAANAVRYNVYKLVSGLYGFIGQGSAGATGFRDNNITPDTTLTPPLANDPFPSAGNFPAAVGYFKGRRWFGGTTNKPLNLYGTRSGTESNMTYSIPTQDDDSINIRLTARQANAIRHIVPLNDLLVFTSGTEWKIDTGGVSGPITPGNVDAGAPQGYAGASNVQPVVTTKSVVYAQAKGGRIREMKYSFESNGYDTNDISIMAPHLFDGYTIKSMAYARAPHPTVWIVRSDGLLIGMTYLPEHDVIAFHKHDSEQGAALYESVCAIPEGEEDRVYFVVKRTVGGATKRFVERLHTRLVTAQADWFLVDCGLTYTGASATVISGLWHLVGKTVSILSAGAVEPQQAVAADGTVTLTHATTKAHIGLPIRADFQTLPPSFEAAAFGQGMKKNINRVHLRVQTSGSVFVGQSFDKLKEIKTRTTEDWGTPPELKTGMFNQMVSPSWNDDAAICIRQDKPLPIMILALAPEVAMGG